MARKPTGNPVGPPPKEFDPKRFQDLCSLQCTQSEMASKFDMSRETLRKKVQDHYREEYLAVYKRYSEEGFISLRSFQFAQARKSTTMAIWLGKIWLKQKEEDNSKEIAQEIFELIKSGQIDKIKEYITQT